MQKQQKKMIRVEPAKQVKESDPRTKPRFIAELFPWVDGYPAPAAATPGSLAARKLRFAFAYYRINLAARNLEITRSRQKSYRASLQALDRALASRDELENEMAPLGIAAEPVMNGAVAADLIFCGPTQFGQTRFTAWVSVSDAAHADPLGKERRLR